MKKKIIISLLIGIMCVLTSCSKTDVTLQPTFIPTSETAITLEPKDMQTDKTKVAYDDEIYIGNKNSKKFHSPNCHTLPAEKNRVEFTSRDEAVNYGYSPCRKCKP